MTIKEFLRERVLDKRLVAAGIVSFAMMYNTGFTDLRPVSVEVDGENLEIHSRYSTPSYILGQAGIEIGDSDKVVITNSEGREAIKVYRAVPVVVEYEGQSQVVKVADATVGDVLTKLGYVGNGYSANLDLATPVASDMVISVSFTEPVPTVEAHDGPVEYAQHLWMEATAYLPTDGGGHGITATGIPATHGVVAVDPNYIPLGTKLYIPGYGYAIAADTGGAIKGHKIDLCMESYHDAIQFGRRHIDVYVVQ